MIIGVCGFGYSGSGAVWDILKECDECKLIGGEKEFTLLYAPDGLDDLRFHLSERPARFMSSDVAITRYKHFVERMENGEWKKDFSNHLCDITNNFLKQITQVEWLGYWGWDIQLANNDFFTYIAYRIRRKRNTILKKYGIKEKSLVKNRKMYLSVMPTEFMTYARDYLKDIIKVFTDQNHSTVVLNQPFPANNPEPYLEYFDDAKALLVIRDPRDIYVTLKRIQDVGSRWFPHDDVEQFIQYFKILHNGMKESERVRIIHFEDLIYRYEETRCNIFEFCNLKQDDSKKKTKFIPEISKRNTMLYKDNQELSEDIKRISEELSDFLYPFDETEVIDHNGAF